MDEMEVKELLRKTSVLYLSISGRYWVDGGGSVKEFEDMSNKYLNNCLNMLRDQKKTIEGGFFLEGITYDTRYQDEIIFITKKLYEMKVKELEDYLK